MDVTNIKIMATVLVRVKKTSLVIEVKRVPQSSRKDRNVLI